MKPNRIGLWGISILVPVILLMTSVRILLNPALLEFEYLQKTFPADTYGFTIEDRLKWGNISVQYLLNDEELSFLGDQQFDDGTPLYNDRELSHMLDVKILVQQMIRAWYLLMILFIATAIYAWQADWMRNFLFSLKRGGWITLGLIGAILLLIVSSFNELFTGFHRIFFQGDTWLFLYSDSLIRLFPMRFWQDAFIWMAVIWFLEAVFVIAMCKWLLVRSKA
jgi:integral membrane protein (TIGR01906 family)